MVLLLNTGINWERSRGRGQESLPLLGAGHLLRENILAQARHLQEACGQLQFLRRVCDGETGTQDHVCLCCSSLPATGSGYSGEHKHSDSGKLHIKAPGIGCAHSGGVNTKSVSATGPLLLL